MFRGISAGGSGRDGSVGRAGATLAIATLGFCARLELTPCTAIVVPEATSTTAKPILVIKAPEPAAAAA
jgi:hypothetical protein